MSHRKAVGCWLALALLAAATSARLAAAEEPAATSEPPPIPVSISIWDSPLRAKVERALAEPSDVDFQDTPLDEAIETLAKRHGVPIVIDKASLADAGVSADTRVTLHVEQATLSRVLRLLLEPIRCIHAISYDVIYVASNDDGARMETRFYPVRDLVRVASAPGIEDYHSLIHLIMTLIEPTDWENVGGRGQVAEYRPTGSLVIRQFLAVHEEIAALLVALRRTKAIDDSHGATRGVDRGL